MPECKQCGSEKTVKSGRIRKKQRYLCKQCGCHFVEGDERERGDAFLIKTLCALFRMLGVKQYRTIGKYLKRDTALIHRWMSGTPTGEIKEGKGYASECAELREVTDRLKFDAVANGNPMLVAANRIDDLYVAIIVQRRDVSMSEKSPGS